MRKHLLSELRFGRKGDRFRNMRFTAPFRILGPFFWQVERSIDQGTTALRRVGQKDANLLIFCASCGATLLTHHTR